MKTFAEYYKDLQLKEIAEIEGRELVSKWNESLILEIEQDFEQAIMKSKFTNSECKVGKSRSNQSFGKKIEKCFVDEVGKKLNVFALKKCSGHGYPDKLLTKVNDDTVKVAFEMKATSNWNSEDSNRRVLTSSSKKLRDNFVEPIQHLICTVIYQEKSSLEDFVRIENVRFDFIEPDSPVGIRLEAAVSHRMLDKGKHEKREFPKKPV